MADILLRSEIFESDRWLDLPSDTHRLAYIRLLSEADGVGNMKGGQRRMWRILRDSCHVKTPEDSVRLMSELQDSDLIRRYEEEGDEYWHIPRYRTTLKWVTKRWPWSPWNNRNVTLSKDKHPRKQGDTKNATPAQGSAVPVQPVVVGVGVGVGVGEKHSVGFADGLSETRERHKAQTAEAVEVLNFLNEKRIEIIGPQVRGFGPNKTNLTPIRARIIEGVSKADCKKVIANRCLAWKSKPDYWQYLNPETIFSPKKFEKYLGNLGVPVETGGKT